MRTQAMQFNHSVRHLDFSDNAIGGGYEKTQRLTGGLTTGGASISLALGVNTTLRRIDLQWNLLGSKVCFSLTQHHFSVHIPSRRESVRPGKIAALPCGEEDAPIGSDWTLEFGQSSDGVFSPL